MQWNMESTNGKITMPRGIQVWCMSCRLSRVWAELCYSRFTGLTLAGELSER